MEKFTRVWFKEEELSDLRREDVKDFLAWRFLYRLEVTADDDEELEEYLNEIESILGSKFVAGRGPCKPSRVSTDPIAFQHKGFLFYSVRTSSLFYIHARKKITDQFIDGNWS